MVNSDMGPAVYVKWAHMQKEIKVSIPGYYWEGSIKKIKTV